MDHRGGGGEGFSVPVPCSPAQVTDANTKSCWKVLQVVYVLGNTCMHCTVEHYIGWPHAKT